MKTIDSGALETLNKSLGITGSSPVGATEFLDSTLDQVLDVSQAVRRGRTLAGSTGLFTVALENIHTSSGDKVTTFLPYSPAVAGSVFPPWPSKIDHRLYDVWLLSASVVRRSGSGSITAILTTTQGNVGVALDSAGDPLAVSEVQQFILGTWNNLIDAGLVFCLENDGGQTLVKPMMRLAPPNNINDAPNVGFWTTTNSAATYQCSILFGIFPVGWGQDAQR